MATYVVEKHTIFGTWVSVAKYATEEEARKEQIRLYHRDALMVRIVLNSRVLPN
jgi:hypothetical protein